MSNLHLYPHHKITFYTVYIFHCTVLVQNDSGEMTPYEQFLRTDRILYLSPHSEEYDDGDETKQTVNGYFIHHMDIEAPIGPIFFIGNEELKSPQKPNAENLFNAWKHILERSR